MMKRTLLSIDMPALAKPLVEQARAEGHRVLPMPVLDAACMPFRVPPAQVWFMLDPMAVRCFREQQRQLPAGRWIALGEETAEAIRKLAGPGIRLMVLAGDSQPDVVSRHRAFRPSGTALQHLAVLGERDAIAPWGPPLQTAGWTVQPCALWRRVVRAVHPPTWRDFQAAEAPALLYRQPAARDALMARLSPADRAWVETLPVWQPAAITTDEGQGTQEREA